METATERTPRFASVTAYLSWDHERLDALWNEVCRMVDDGELERAGAYFLEFQCGLQRHIHMEEAILFPAFERLTGIEGGPTLVLRGEHQELGELLVAAEAAPDRGDAAGFQRARHSLTSLLARHNTKEERYLYRGLDRALGSELEAMVQRLERV